MEKRESMLVVVLSWIYYFVLCLFVGIGVEKGLAKLFGKRWTFQVIDYLVAGMPFMLNRSTLAGDSIRSGFAAK